MSTNVQQLRRENKLSLQVVADAETCAACDAYLFEIGAIVDHETKQKIIQAFSQLMGPSSREEQPTVAIHPIGHSRRGNAHDLHQ